MHIFQASILTVAIVSLTLAFVVLCLSNMWSIGRLLSVRLEAVWT